MLALWLKKALAALILPPAGPLLMAALGLLLARRRPRLGRALAWAGLLSLWLMATSAVTQPLLAALEDLPPLDPRGAARAQAIVVLGGGSYPAAPEYGGDTVSSGTLERLRYAARLQRETGLPILVTGGAPAGGRAEARNMQEALESDFHARVRWVEEHALDTGDNARLSAALLRQAGVTRVLLVTHAWHMRRARGAFAGTGVETLAAPTGYAATAPLAALDFLPGPGGLAAGRTVLHECLGRFVQGVGQAILRAD